MDLNLSVLQDCVLCLGSADMYVAHVCCTALQRAEHVACQLHRRRWLIIFTFKKLRWTILSSGKEHFTIWTNSLCQIEPEIQFFNNEGLQNKHLADACRNTELFLEVKNSYSKHEQCPIETLINNYLVQQNALYCLNGNDLRQIYLEILTIFSTRSMEHSLDNQHLVSNLLMCAKHRTFLEVKNN